MTIIPIVIDTFGTVTKGLQKGSPEKPGLIPTFCKRINRTSTAVGRWVVAFEERRRTTFYVTKFICNKQ